MSFKQYKFPPNCRTILVNQITKAFKVKANITTTLIGDIELMCLDLNWTIEHDWFQQMITEKQQK
jgi:hypothetical protein